MYTKLNRDASFKNAHFKWRSGGVFKLRISQITQRNHCMNALTSKSRFGGRAKWPSNHFRLYTARCICTEAQEMWVPCLFDWPGTQTFFSRWNAESQIRSLVCTLRNSNITITSLSNYALCSRVKTVKDHKYKCFHTKQFCVKIVSYDIHVSLLYENNWQCRSV